MTTHDSNEVEIKFLVHDAEALVHALQSAGFHQKTPPPSRPTRSTTPPSAISAAPERFCASASMADHWKLTHKSRGTAGKHKSRVEHETAVANGDEMHAILTALGFSPSFRYEKYRAEWSDGAGEVVIDRTPIGDLAEIEGAPEWIDRIAKAPRHQRRRLHHRLLCGALLPLEAAYRQPRSQHDLRGVRSRTPVTSLVIMGPSRRAARAQQEAGPLPGPPDA